MNRLTQVLTPVAAALVLAICPVTHAQSDFEELHKLTASDAAVGDFFGFSVGISGNTAIVGALFDDTGTPDDPITNSGSAYLINAATGVEIVRLTAEDAAANDGFGTSVGISGNTAIVGAIQDGDAGTNSGSAYLFNATTGTQTFKLTASDASAGDIFGSSVGISGNTAIVGATLGDTDTTDGSVANTGAAYLFNASTGVEFAKLTASDATTGGEFGFSVDISGNTAIVGAPSGDADTADGSIANSGSAYLFDATTGIEIAKLTASDPAGDDSFGRSVAISGNTAIVGAFGDDDGVSNSGSAYLFDVTTGDQFAKLTAEDAAIGDNFGISVGISGNTAIVGAFRDDDAGFNSNSGSAYLFNATTGDQIGKITASDAEADDRFGFSVGISGNTAIVGADSNDDAGSASGSAYLFGTDVLTATPISGGDLAFTLNADESATLDDIISLINTGADGTTLEVTGFDITGTDADLFDLLDFAPATLTAGDTDTVAYDLTFLGTPLAGDYFALLTLITDSGNVAYNLSATVHRRPRARHRDAARRRRLARSDTSAAGVIIANLS